MIYGIAENMSPLKPLFPPFLGLSLTVFTLVFALLKLWVFLKLAMRIRVTRFWKAALFNTFVIWAEHSLIAECLILTSSQMTNHCVLGHHCSHLRQREETNLSVLLKMLSVNYRVHLLQVDVLIFFIPANSMSMLGSVCPQQNFAGCSLCGEVLNQLILYWLTLSLTTYFFLMWCDSWHTNLCLPTLGKFIVFIL